MDTKDKKQAIAFKGTLNDRFQIIHSLGEEGGNGKAYLAWDTQNNTRVAIKKMKTNNDKDRVMVEKEGLVMSKIDHPNVLKVISYGECVYQCASTKKKGKWLYLVLELA